MDLSSMIAREDFFPIFFETLKKYYHEVYEEDVRIEFADKKECNLVIKPRLSAATSPYLSSKARSFFYSEWNVRNSIVKYIVAKLGVFVLTRTGKLFSQFTFRMTPEHLVNRDLVIVPNNRSIRVFDYHSNTVGCIVKHGFTQKYFSNQLQFRLKYQYPFMLPMVKWRKDWFIEPILQGHPLARVTEKISYEKGMQDALLAIKQLARDTTEIVEAGQYIACMLSRIRELTENAVSRKGIVSAENVLQLAETAAFAAKSCLHSVPTCMSHGDFQEGNIWVDNDGKTWLYDWETAGRRSIWYDSSVLCYSLRRQYGWAQFLEEACPEKMLNCDDGKNRSADEYFAMKNVVFMEDMLFYLEDMLELPQDWGRDIFESYIQRMQATGIAKGD